MMIDGMDRWIEFMDKGWMNRNYDKGWMIEVDRGSIREGR